MTSGCESVSCSSASPPARRTKSRTHSPACRTSPACCGSALTLGIRSSSESSSSQAWSTTRESKRLAGGGGSGYVAENLRVGERAKLLQRLILDLPDALARHVERATDLVERARMLAVEPVAQDQHLALAHRELVQQLLERLAPERRLRRLVRKRCALVGDEVAELRLLLVSDRLLQRDRRLRAAADLLHLVRRQVEIERDLGRRRLAAELGAELALRAHDLVQLLDDVHRHTDRPGLVGERARDSLADPPRRVRRELEALAVVELLRGADEADRSLLDQVEEREALVAVTLRDRDDEAKVRLDHLLLRAMVTTLDALRELDLLRRREQVDAADVLQEQLERVRRHLRRRGGRLVVEIRGSRRHDLDLLLLERLVQLVELAGLEVEIVERERDLLCGDRAVLA